MLNSILKGWLTLSTISIDVNLVSVSRRAHAATILVYAEALLQVAYAVAFFTYHHIRLPQARYAVVVLVLAETGLADAITMYVADLTLLDRALENAH